MESRAFFRCHRSGQKFQFAFAVLFAASVLLAPLSAQATGATIKRSVSNMLMAPLDFVTAPVTTVRILVNGFKTQDDSTLVRASYVVPGFIFLNLLEMGGSVIREVSGLLELAPGVVLVFSQSDMQPLFAPPEQAIALVDADIVVLHLKFGLDYTNTLSGGRQGEDFGVPTEERGKQQPILEEEPITDIEEEPITDEK